MKTTAVETVHKSKIENIRQISGHELSSHAFASLFLWQERMELSLYLQDDFFAVKGGIFGRKTWFFPCGSEDASYTFIKNCMSDKSFSMVYLRECDVKWLKERFPDKWEFRRVEESDEYICDISEYIALNGGKFSEIRRNIRKIDSLYDVSFEKITEENFSDALSVVSQWASTEHNTGDKNLTDDDVSETALQQMNTLDVSGIIMYLEGIPVSVFAGFPLTEDTLDVLIGKCVKNAPRGTVYYALREYLSLNKDEFVYCNHEEDLGIPGIRRVKNSLCPIRKNIIWEAIQK